MPVLIFRCTGTLLPAPAANWPSVAAVCGSLNTASQIVGNAPGQLPLIAVTQQQQSGPDAPIPQRHRLLQRAQGEKTRSASQRRLGNRQRPMAISLILDDREYLQSGRVVPVLSTQNSA